MTEPARAIQGGGPNALQARPLPARSLPARSPGTARLSVVPPRTAARPAAPTRRPIHVVVAVGMTAGLYAVSLAGVTALQSAADTQLAADHAPAAGAVAQLKTTHDAMESSLSALAGIYSKAANGYEAISSGIAQHEQALAALRAQVSAATGSAAALSVSSLARLPAVSTSAAAGSSRPVVNACTTASGKPC
ncbi:MAG TPA: hypothetical protein VIH94_02640 [Candidatus Limnocylindrales bacterium]